MLTSVSAKDLFLAYHQDCMAKRLLDCLNEPKLESEFLLLRLLADNLGNILLNPHFSMIKDIQSSIDVTEHLSKILPFISYKWDLKVLNTTVWPDSALKIRFSHMYSSFYSVLLLPSYSIIYINCRICTNSTEASHYSGNWIEAFPYFKASSSRGSIDFRQKTYT